MVNKYKDEKFVHLDYDEIDSDEYFEISNFGRIKSYRTKTDGKIIKGSFISGYNTVQVKLKDGRMKTYYMHKIVADYFCKKAHEQQDYVIHLDYKKKNNNYLNLKWVNGIELGKHRAEDPDYNSKKVRNSKLTESQVKSILRRLKKLKKPTANDFRSLAKKNNITVTQIRRIANGENWSHIKA